MSDESRNSWKSCETNSPALSEWKCPMRLVGCPAICPVRLLKSATHLRMRAGASLLRVSGKTNLKREWSSVRMSA
eukprot:2034695-Prymnesium_polylepis.1